VEQGEGMWTMTTLRKEVRKRLRNPDLVIKIKSVKRPIAAYSYEDDVIVIDTYRIDIAAAVVHEILHWLLDSIYEKKVAYSIYEEWIKSLEAMFFDGMTTKQCENFERLVRSRMED